MRCHDRSLRMTSISILTVSMAMDRFNLHCMLHAANLLEERLRHRLADIGISPRQARVIDALDRMGAVSQVALAREFGITPASMSTMTARLIAADFVTRRIDPEEARSNIVELTQRGRELLSEVQAAWRDIDALIADTMGAKDAARLAALARRLRDGLGGTVPGATSDTPPRAIEQEKTG